MIFTDGEHLVSNIDENELHDFAQHRIKLSKNHFCGGIRFPHYELPNEQLVNLAVEKGAKKVMPMELLCEVSKCLVL